MGTGLYRRLMDAGASGGDGDPFDRHVFACVLALAASDPDRPLSEALGLSGTSLRALLAAHFPAAMPTLIEVPAEAHAGEDALEEPDLRALLIEFGTRGAVEETWLAAIVARRSLGANHLWQDMGLTARSDLSALLNRHFRPLAERNVADMKWKKFFYRQLCEREGVVVCKAPNCAVCTDVALCFGGESGEPLAQFQTPPPPERRPPPQRAEPERPARPPQG